MSLFRHDPGGCDIALPVIDLLDQQGLAFGVKAPPRRSRSPLRRRGGRRTRMAKALRVTAPHATVVGPFCR